MKYCLQTLFLLFFLLMICTPLSVSAQNRRRIIPNLPPKPLYQETQSNNSSSDSTLKRVDPHGQKDIKITSDEVKKKNECLVCHFTQGADLKVKATASTSCFNCHNRSPHSGIAEHLKHKISCIDCHAVHRNGATELNPTSDIFKNLRENTTEQKNIDPGLVEKKSTSAMLKKSCTECHKK